MFDFLKEIDGRLYERYLTLERNVKAGSNSFYDAYLDMQEHFVKLVCDGLSMELQKSKNIHSFSHCLKLLMFHFDNSIYNLFHNCHLFVLVKVL